MGYIKRNLIQLCRQKRDSQGLEPEDILNAVAQAQKTNATSSFSDANLSFKFLDLCVSLGTHVEDKILVKALREGAW